MSIETFLSGYVFLLLAALLLLALYSEHRQRQFGPTSSQDHIFRCESCGFVYTDDADVDRSRCSQCGAMNEAIKF